ncbi:MAG: glycosyltransferase family 4 protein [Vicinamibacterales bacterium]|nr:glycosyltransferase family 4 protein [Vicinamibacterales bacterium]
MNLHLVVPGSLEQRTGGYIYDARIVDGLRRLGWRVLVHNLGGTFPDADTEARANLRATLATIPDGERVVIDGLAMGGLPEPVRAERDRLRILALVHHPLADETGLDEATRARFVDLERAALAVCAGVLVTSEFTARRLGTLGMEPAGVRAVRPGLDPAPPAIGPGPGAAPALLCVASLIPRKGQDGLVRALSTLRDLPWSCVCAGSLHRAPAFAEVVMALARERRLDDRIRFPGECEPDALDNLYHRASLFVLPSHYEGYGMALTDAMARGLGVVSTTGGAIPHTVSGAAAVLVPPGDDTALAEALGRVLAVETGARRRAEMASAARRHADGLPDWTQAAQAFAEATIELTTDGDV